MKFFIILLGVFLFANDSYKKCTVCHGKEGEKPALGKSKIIKDMNSSEIIRALNGYKDGSYGGALKGTMKGQVKGLSDEDMKNIAEYISKEKQ